MTDYTRLLRLCVFCWRIRPVVYASGRCWACYKLHKAAEARRRELMKVAAADLEAYWMAA